MSTTATQLSPDRRFNRYVEVLNAINKDTLGLLDEVYASDLRFQDPVHALEGIPAFREYLARLYANVLRCHFTVGIAAVQGDTTIFTWNMEMEHARFRKGEVLRLPGMTALHYNSAALIDYHQDSFDLGAMLYERLPVLGSIVRRIKGAL